MHVAFLLFALYAPAAETDGDAAQAVARLNTVRAAAGLKPVTLDANLSAGCLSHAKYLAKNVHPLKGAPANPHDESKDLAGYTKEGEQAGHMAEISYSRGSNAFGAEVIDEFLNCFYHRIAFIRPDLARFGFAQVRFGDKECWMVLNARSGREPGEDSSQTIAYPADKQKNIPLLFTEHESPDPIPPEGKNNRAGFPITVTFPDTAKVEGADLILRDSKGKDVEGWFSSPEKPAGKRELQYNTVALIPKAPLRVRTTYTATVTATVDGKEWRKTWVFTTVSK
jgi:hypothetical protein